ncbi:hypothetical protein [Agrobacterium rosae]|uniref:Uncharacterized protein n=1 Tax=Agrobacterium rosae TaxID=1972867 RepID=A0AAW9FGZ4_9HYPH|nr:hypothetical protein [Agrobacterium rosae]MDX8305882.1 hypothetical protein [Agrobacterium rosae]
MTKKPSGLAAFTRKGTPEAAQLAVDDSEATASTAPALRKKRGGGEVVALTVKVRRIDWQRLRQLADAEGTTIQAMAEAGFSAVLAQHGLPPIDPHSR